MSSAAQNALLSCIQFGSHPLRSEEGFIGRTRTGLDQYAAEALVRG
jgi:hypothetical protein